MTALFSTQDNYRSKIYKIIEKGKYMQIIMSKSQKDSSEKLYNLIIDEALKNPYRMHYIIVPEQYTHEVQKNVVNKSSNKCIMNIDVLSFNRLAFKIIQEIGGPELEYLSEEGKSFLVLKIAKGIQNNLNVFSKHIKNPGYIEKIKSTLSEFSQYDISLEDLSKLINDNSINAKLKNKICDLILFKQKYEEMLGEGKFSKDSFLIKVSNKVKEGKILDDSVVAFDNFTGFTPDQYIFMSKILDVTNKSFLSVVFDPNIDYKKDINQTDKFCLSSTTIKTIEDLCKKKNIDFLEPIKVNSNDNSGKEIFYFASDSKRDEIDKIKHEVIKLIYNGYNYKDIGIVCLDENSYRKYFKNIFSQNNIPYFLGDNDTLLDHSFGRYICSYIDLIKENFSKESVFNYLKSGYSSLESNEIFIIENYVRALEIKGIKKWESIFAKIPRYLSNDNNERRDYLETINSIRRKFLDEVYDNINKLKNAKTVNEYCDIILNQTANAKDILFNISTRTNEEGDLYNSLKFEDVYDLFEDVINELKNVIGDEIVTVEEFYDYLKLGFLEKKFKMIPPTLDQIIIGDLKRTRFGDIKALFVCGCSDTNLPKISLGNGIISDYDKVVLEKCGVVISPSAKKQIGIDRFYFYLHYLKPSEKFYISYASYSEKTPETLSFIANNYIEKDNAKYLEIKDDEIISKSEALKFISSHILESKKDVKIFDELYGYLSNDKDYQDKLNIILDGYEQKVSGDNLSKEIADKLFSEIVESSISQLNTYSQCPYKYFLQYKLGLKEREEFKFSAADNGTLAHNVLDDIFKKLRVQGKSLKNATSKEISSLVKTSVEERALQYKNTLLYSSNRNEYILNRLESTLIFTLEFHKNRLLAGEFDQIESEKRFKIDKIANSKNETQELVLKNSKKLVINGSIDRLEKAISNDGLEIYNVIDYKTGNKTLDLKTIYDGRDLQLPIYAAFCKKNNNNISVGNIAYYPVSNKVLNLSKPSEYDAERILKDRRKKIMGNGLLNLGKELNDTSTGFLQYYGQENEVEKYYNLKKGSVSDEQMNIITDYAIIKAMKIASSMSDGRIEATPYRDSKTNNDEKITETKTCSRCAFKNVCRYDKSLSTCNYRSELNNFSDDNDSELFEMMKEILDKGNCE